MDRELPELQYDQERTEAGVEAPVHGKEEHGLKAHHGDEGHAPAQLHIVLQAATLLAPGLQRPHPLGQPPVALQAREESIRGGEAAPRPDDGQHACANPVHAHSRTKQDDGNPGRPPARVEVDPEDQHADPRDVGPDQVAEEAQLHADVLTVSHLQASPHQVGLLVRQRHRLGRDLVYARVVPHQLARDLRLLHPHAHRQAVLVVLLRLPRAGLEVLMPTGPSLPEAHVLHPEVRVRPRKLPDENVHHARQRAVRCHGG
mmetsp:Transcript_41637/g.129538  ORF Transcript_41637/g.129538 Transcript_41637/m.129538 type:complete len:259 (-) Transcript_41637:833-1609(-)